jgi:uncharacterized repeat protein (TIGR01451 family)
MKLNILFLFLILMFLSHNLSATHLLGGTMNYKTISKTNDSIRLQFSMKIFRDCYRGRPNAFFDSTAVISIFSGVGELARTVDVPLNSYYKVGECGVGNVCIQVGEYNWEVSLPIIEMSYFFVYQRCCRTNVVQNLVGSETSGNSIVLELTKNAQKLVNNHSPISNLKSPLGICVGKPVNLDFKAIDFEQDSIKYELVPSFLGGSTGRPIPNPSTWPIGTVSYKSGFTSMFPFGGNVYFEGSSFKGFTDVQGQFAFTVAYSEYRNGILLTKSYFDYTISIFDCGASTIDYLCFSSPVIRGNVFFDSNNDNIKDTDEAYIPNALVSSPSNWSNFTNQKGNFTVNVDTNKNYTFKIVNLNPDNFGITPIERTLKTTNLPSQFYDSQDFIVKSIRPVDNLVVDLVLGNARPGFTSITTLSYRNSGTTILNGTLSLVLDSKQVFANANIWPVSQNNNVLIWRIENLKPFEQKQLFVEIFTTVEAPLRSFVSSKLTGNIIGNDIDITDNSKSETIEVRGAYDPNDITVNKTSIRTNDKIQINALDYLIRFQNTGNLSAIKVEVQDTLADKLDFNSIEMLTASHLYEMQVVNNQNRTDNFSILKWIFNDINLPDSISNEKGSHGFISYRIKNNPKKMAFVSDSIFNRAAIFFDFNAPVITNKAKTIFTSTVAVFDIKNLGLNVFPNPTTGIVTINTMNKDLKDIFIDIVNLNGQFVLREKLNGINPSLNIQSVAEGLYFIKISTNEGSRIFKMLKL